MPERRGWRTPEEVPPDTHTGEQLRLMRRLVQGEISGAAFDEAWWDRAHRADEAGERPVHDLALALRLVSAAAEDYVGDPELRDPEDLDDEALVTAVTEALHTFDRPQRGRRKKLLEPGTELDVRVQSHHRQGVTVAPMTGERGTVPLDKLASYVERGELPGLYDKLRVVVLDATRSHYTASNLAEDMRSHR
ncbi:hypothetical protein ACIBF1_04425 [Spirillospora sp. NPDC050679]